MIPFEGIPSLLTPGLSQVSRSFRKPFAPKSGGSRCHLQHKRSRDRILNEIRSSPSPWTGLKRSISEDPTRRFLP